MHTTEVGVSNVPAFLVKLWKLVEDEKCNDLISWSSNGQSFIIHNQTQFAKELLPLYFKHNNMASFIRQLNMYGFRKVANIDQGLRSDREGIEFFHNFFVRGQECLLEFIKRKVPSGRAGGVSPDDGRAHNEVLKELLSNVGSMQGRQEHMDQLLADMKKENEALWREVARLRQKHMKQQQIVEKLIQFLVTMVQANRNITVKRKMPLMLHDSPNSSSKVPRLTKATFVTDYQVTSPAGSQMSEGPVIRDVTDLMDDLGETTSIAVSEPVTAGQSPRVVEVSVAGTPVLSLASPAASSDLDAGPIVASPLSTADVIEPLCLLEPLEEDQSSDVLPCDIQEVIVDSSDSSPKEPVAASSTSLVTPTVESVQIITPDTSTVEQITPNKLVFSASPLIGGEKPAGLSSKQAANGASDLLSSCIMLEDLPLFAGDNTPSPAAAGLPATSSDLAEEETSGHSEVATAPPANTGMQVALQDKTAGTTKVFADHVESIDSDLDWLQDQLMSGGLNLDTSTLMGLFSPEDLLTSRLGDLATENRCPSDAVGNEVVQYTPSLIDLGIEEDPSFQPVNELLLSDDELPSNSSVTNVTNGASVSSLTTTKDSPSSRSMSPSLLYPDDFKAAIQTAPRLVGKKGSTLGKKRRGSSRK
uniref:Putative heat shock factor 1 n=1 Tax=Amblyomma triste TaxID=251400 RepID=A0A023GNX6_AMBTT